MNEAAIDILESGWRMFIRRHMLSSDSPEELDERDRPMRAESLTTFIKLIVAVWPDKKAALGLNNCGHLIATWIDGKDRLTMECLPDDQVRWTSLRCTASDGMEQSSEVVPLKQLLPALVGLDRQGSMRRFYR